MNPFVFACMTPHGSEIIEELAPKGNRGLMGKTRESMERLGREMAAAKPDAIIVLTPHGLRLDGMFCITDSERMHGELEDNGSKVTMERQVDRELAKAIYAAAKEDGVPVGAANFATASGPYSCLPLDWGVIVPLSFMPVVPVVVLTPTRSVPLADHLRLGESLARAVTASGKRVGLIASCDWSHAHDENGPYGYDPAAEAMDAHVIKLLQANDIEAMMDFSPAFIEAAKPDGIWQILVLAGAIPKAERRVEFLSYEVPTYFGLMCAAYRYN